MNVSTAIRVEYGKILAYPEPQWAYILSKTSEYGSTSWDMLARAYGSDITDLYITTGTFFQVVGTMMILPDDLAILWRDMVTLTDISPDERDDVDRVQRLCSLYIGTLTGRGNNNLDRAARDIRMMKRSIIDTANDITIQRFLGDRGVDEMIEQNPSLTYQDATDAIWVIGKFVAFCIRAAEMITI